MSQIFSVAPATDISGFYLVVVVHLVNIKSIWIFFSKEEYINL